MVLSLILHIRYLDLTSVFLSMRCKCNAKFVHYEFWKVADGCGGEEISINKTTREHVCYNIGTCVKGIL